MSWTLLWLQLASTQSTFLKFFKCSRFLEFDSKQIQENFILSHFLSLLERVKTNFIVKFNMRSGKEEAQIRMSDYAPRKPTYQWGGYSGVATVYLFKWAGWNFHRSCEWADFVAVQMGHKIKEKELKPRFHMLGNSYTIGDFTFCRLSQTLPIYWILATRLSQILPILNLAGNGKCVKNWNLRDRGTEAQIFRGLVKSEIHCRRPRRYKFEFSFIGNDRRRSQKSWMHLENRDAPDSPDLSLTIPNDRGYLWVEFS